MREWLPELCALPLLPVLHWQGRRTRARVVRLPEPDDDSRGVVEGGAEPALRLLMVGESPVAGVGVQSYRQSIAAQTAQALSKRLARPVCWQAIGKNGATVAWQGPSSCCCPRLRLGESISSAWHSASTTRLRSGGITNGWQTWANCCGSCTRGCSLPAFCWPVSRHCSSFPHCPGPCVPCWA